MQNVQASVESTPIACQQCGATFIRPKYKPNKKFCSNKCANAFNARQRTNNQAYRKRHRKLEHRHIVELQLGRLLTQDEIVHHIDGNGLNNTPENLQLMSRSEHAKHHGIGGKRPGAGRKCIGNARTEPRTISLPPELWEYTLIEELGDGEYSAGVRAALVFHAEHHGKSFKLTE